MTDRDIQNAPIRWKAPGAGFIGAGGFVALVDRDPDPFPCVVFDGPEEERKATRGRAGRPGPPHGRWRATRWRRRGRPWPSAGSSAPQYHLSDCELLEDRPPEHAS